MSGNDRARRRTLLHLGAAMVILASLLAVGPDWASAVANTGAFELDGNAVSNGLDDWDRVCHEVTITNDTDEEIPDQCVSADDTDGASAVEWADDGALNATIFSGGGSKDPQPIGNWAWKDQSGGLPDKDNLLHSFAARYSLDPDPVTCPAGMFPTCEVLFFGSDRFDNSGDAHQAFWFFQDEIGLGDNKVGGAFGFTGEHVAGDLLVISNFSNGGTTSTIAVYEWDPTCTKAGGPCGDANLRTLASSNNAKCDPAVLLSFCGIVNPANGTTAPWSYTDKSGNNSYLQGEFYEGAINLSALGLADRCFASVASETRSSTSTTATLKDFVLGGFGKCESSIVTTPSVGADGESIGTGSVTVTDDADVTVDGTSTWEGTVQFSLCGPIDEEGDCTKVDIGDPIEVDDDTDMPITSPSATVTAAGDYCWSSFFESATEGVPDAIDESETECFTINPVTPTLATTAGADVVLGQPVTDTASLSGTANQPGSPAINPTVAGAAAGGTIKFTLVKSDCTTLATGTGTNPQTVNVSGNGQYGPVSFTPDAVGTYHWKADYTPAAGDPNNLPSTHNGDCSDSNETVVVQSLNTAIATRQFVFPNDKAVITAPAGGGNLAGTVTFKLYDTLAECNANGEAGLLYTQSMAVSGASPQAHTTTNTSVRVSVDDTVYWRVSYASTNPAHNSSLSSCVESTQVDFTGDDGTISIP